MKASQRFSAIAMLMVFVLSNCSTDEGVNPKQDAESINAHFSTFPDWFVEEIEPKPDSLIETIEVQNVEGTDNYECPVYEQQLVQTVNNFVSVGTNFGIIWPGAMIQGNSLESGELKLINTKRAPITLVTNIALDEVSKEIIPNSVNAQQAVADFMIAAGELPEGSQAGAGTMLFQIEEATTFEQSMLSMGITAGFTDPQSSIGLDGSLTVSSERSSNTHTVVAKYVQQMFTVRVADDLIANPSDFFADDFTTEDLEALETSGAMGADNLPLYIESVTYGRILLFSMQSKSVSSSNELSAALEASMADYANLGGELSENHEEIFSTATHKIFSAGGTDAAANAAVANLDWSKFFVESPASTAVPISFVARTVHGKKIVSLVQSEVYQRRDNCDLIVPDPVPTAKSYDITVTWSATSNTGLCLGGGSFGTCKPAALITLEKETWGTSLTALNGYKRAFSLQPDEDGDGNSANDKMKFSIRSSSQLWGFAGLLPVKTETKTYNVISMPEGNTTLKHTFTNVVGSITLTYTINKKTNF